MVKLTCQCGLGH